jgi:UDP-N-acetylglucosamine transferase subunit ALG13
MIFVTVGNATQGFSRLLKAVDELTGKGVFESDSVFIQSGNNPDFFPSHCKHEPFLPMEEFARKVCDADLIVCHAGAGTLLHVLRAGKVPVVMPRRKKYGEHVDDHQLELVQVLASEDRVIPAYEPEDLPTAIEEPRRRNRQPVPPSPSLMQSLVAQAIEDLIGKPENGRK